MNQIPSKYEKLTFYTLLTLWLLPVWTVSYFLTGDGPCHLYNSRILLDWLQGKHTYMYRYFMNSNPHIDPNWITNFIQVPLLAIFPAAFAEKVFYTLYLLGFAFGFRFLIKQINPKALYLCGIGLIFAWHHIVFKGFSNNSISIAVWFWIAGCWLKYREAPFGKAVVLQMILALLGYFSHPMGFIYSGLMIACMLIGDTIAEIRQHDVTTGLKYFEKQLFRLIVAYLPALILFAIFIGRRSWSGENSGYNNEVWENFIKMPALVGLNHKEEGFAIAISLFCFIMLVFCIVKRTKKQEARKNTGLILFVIIVFLTTIFPPASMLGGLDVPRRLIMLPLLAILFFVATVETGSKWQSTTIIFGIVITVGMLAIRLPILWQTSTFAKEVVSCKEMIRPLSTVMTLNYDLDPHNINGEKIIDAEWINVHTDCYIGAYKPMIIAGNYELNFNYFPFMGIGEKSFYYLSAKEGKTFEELMPRADFNAYKKATGVQIDYVILIGLNEEQQKHEYTQEVLQQLNNDYEKIYTSPHGIAILYRNKSGFKNPWLK
jgi:hypothetical protein